MLVRSVCHVCVCVRRDVRASDPQISFAAYLPHEGDAYLFIEAPKGLSAASRAKLDELIAKRKLPVDHLRILRDIPRDRRHASKADTGALFAPSKVPALLRLLLLIILLAVVTVLFLHWRGDIDARELPALAAEAAEQVQARAVKFAQSLSS